MSQFEGSSQSSSPSFSNNYSSNQSFSPFVSRQTNQYGSNSSSYSPHSSQNPTSNSYRPPYADNRLSDNYQSQLTTDTREYKPAYLREPEKKPSYSLYNDKTNQISHDSGANESYDGFSSSNLTAEKLSMPKTPGSVTDPENLRYYHMFNLKSSPYRLKHYLYFTEDVNLNFNITNYNRMDIRLGRPPMLKHYLRFYDMKYDYELNPQGKNYGDMYTLTASSQNPNIIYSKEYKGKYSTQLDYINFKVMMAQEKYQ